MKNFIDRSRNLNVLEAGSDVLVEVDGRDERTQLTNAVLVLDIVSTKLVGIHFIPFILPLKLLSVKILHTTISLLITYRL